MSEINTWMEKIIGKHEANQPKIRYYHECTRNHI